MRVQAFVINLLFTILAPLASRGEIIIDDFDDPAQVVLPEMENVRVLTTGVGVLNADRRISVFSSQTDPIGQLDADITRPSHLTARIDGQFLDNPLNTPLLAFSAGYDFTSPADLTEGGVNNAVFLDIRLFQGSGIPGELSVGLVDGNDTFLAILSRFGLVSDSPYTLMIPFSSFGIRGSGGGRANFAEARLLGFTARLLTGSPDPNTHWLVQIDRIRVGRIVPEPNIDVLALVGAVVLVFVGFQERGLRIASGS